MAFLLQYTYYNIGKIIGNKRRNKMKNETVKIGAKIGATAGKSTRFVRLNVGFDSRLAHAYPISREEITGERLLSVDSLQ